MKSNQSSYLAQVSPSTVMLDERLTKPTSWDRDTVLDDLKYYISKSRIVHAIPTLLIQDDALVVIDGWPFLRAAQEAVPPLEQVVCRIIDDGADSGVSVDRVEVSTLLHQACDQDLYRAIEVLSFVNCLAPDACQQTEHAILEFFITVSKNARFGGRYTTIDTFIWDIDHQRVEWAWERNDSPGRHMLMFAQVLNDISRHIAQVRSWNGHRIGHVALPRHKYGIPPI